jgi:hypothetical protein
MAVLSTTVSPSNRVAARASLLIPSLALVGAPVMLLQGAAYRFRPEHPNQFWGAMELLYLFGWMSSIVGLLRLNATGTNVGGRLILGTQLVTPPTIENGHILTPKGPGWGADIVEDVLKEHPVS